MARQQHAPRYLWRAAVYAAVTLLIYVGGGLVGRRWHAMDIAES